MRNKLISSLAGAAFSLTASGFAFAAAGVAFSGLIAAWVMPAAAAKKQPPAPHPVVERSASGTIIQPTTTIIPGGNGHNTVIVIPRRRSYLDTGTEVSVGDRNFQNYVLPPGGDPGRPNWFFGPDVQGHGHYPLPWRTNTPYYGYDSP